jgi:hypothetical protein
VQPIITVLRVGGFAVGVVLCVCRSGCVLWYGYCDHPRQPTACYVKLLANHETEAGRSYETLRAAERSSARCCTWSRLAMPVAVNRLSAAELRQQLALVPRLSVVAAEAILRAAFRGQSRYAQPCERRRGCTTRLCRAQVGRSIPFHSWQQQSAATAHAQRGARARVVCIARHGAMVGVEWLRAELRRSEIRLASFGITART